MTTRKRKSRRWEVGKQLMSLGNIAAAALLFGQAFSGYAFSFTLAILGLLLWAWLYVSAIALMKGGGS